MLSKHTYRLVAAMLALLLCLALFPVPASAYADDGTPLTPEGNMSVVDDITEAGNGSKQFITVVSKAGNYFYIIIDRSKEGDNTVHFLNKVDEADLEALIEEGTAKPIVCSCTDKCAAGAINTVCELCMMNMTQCVGKEPAPVTTPEPEEPAEEPGMNFGAVIVVFLIMAIAAAVGFYFFVYAPRNEQFGYEDDDMDDYEDV